MKKTKLGNWIFTLLFLFALILIMMSTYLFLTGFHNVDLAQNIRYLNAEYNLDLGDYSSQGYITAEDLLTVGYKQQRLGFFLGLAGAFWLGFSLMYFIEEGEE